jgi:ribosomal protein S18 acetylase RimI-like enzyme
MSELPEELFADPIWHALRTRHRHLALAAGDARRYPADVAPFASLAAPERSAWEDLRSLLVEGESVWLALPAPPVVATPGLRLEGSLECVQMALPVGFDVPEPSPEVQPMSVADAPSMVALTDLAFPGFFRERTYRMGAYWGVRSSSSSDNGELIAMGGERLRLDGYSEMSGICTHPDHRGKGLAANILWRLARDHQQEGVVSWLHVSASNAHAIALYLRLGFAEVRRIVLYRVSRPDQAPRL